jgi:hypothetical protein
MWKFLIGLAATVAVGAAIQASPALAAEAGKPGTLLLAQSGEQQQKAAAEAARAVEQKKQKELEKSIQRDMQMEKSDSKSIFEPPAASGTKRLGGQTIRDKETLEGD